MVKEVKVRIVGDTRALKNALSSGVRDVRDFSSNAKNALSELDKELRVINGSAELFGNTLQTDVAKVRAYQNAISTLLRSGVSPTSPKVLELAGNVDKLNSSMAKAGKSIGSTNGVAIEFSRIIQDAPYGIIGVGNNITQLTQSFAYLQQRTGSTSAALKAAFASMLTGSNLLVLGISAITTAITLYSMRSRAASKDTKNAEKATRDYAASLSTLSRVHYEAAGSYGSTIARLNTLIAVTRDNTISVQRRKEAMSELQRIYPNVFKNFDTETIKTEKAADAYRELTRTLIAQARVRAAEEMIADESKKEMALALENRERQKKIDLIEQENEKLRQSGAELKDYGLTDQQLKNVEWLQSMGDLFLKTNDANEKASIQYTMNLAKIKQLSNESIKNGHEFLDIQETINFLTKEAVENQKQVNGLLLNSSTNAKKAETSMTDYVQAIRDVFNLEVDSSNLVGLDGLERIQQQTQNGYRKLLDKVDEIEKTGLAKNKNNEAERIRITQEANAERLEINTQLNAELQANEQKYYADRNKMIEDMVKSNEDRVRQMILEGRDRDIEATRVKYDTMFQQAAGNAEAIAQLTEQHRAELSEINRKWDEADTEMRDRLQLSVADTFENMLLNSESIFKQLGNAFKRMVVRMIAEAAALRVVGMLVSALGLGPAGGIVGALGSIFGGGGNGGGSLLKSLGGLSGGSAVSNLSTGLQMSTPTLNRVTTNNQIIIPEVKVSGSDLRLVFNRAQTSNTIFGGGK